MMNMRYAPVIALILLCVNACSLFSDKEEEETQSAELYQRAEVALSVGNYSEAIQIYEEMEIKFPFSPYAPNVALKVAYAHYKSYDALIAVDKLDFFIKQYPNHPNLDYAYYLKGRANYNYARSFIHLVINYDRTNKDPEPLKNAFVAFKTLVQEYPDSNYADDAHRHLTIIRNLLAIYEIKVANYYFNRSAYIATVNRVQYMLENYAGAKNTPDGMLLMAEAYRRMGEKKHANNIARVLKLNFPNYATRHLDKTGKVILDLGGDDWDDTLDDLSDTILETLRLKPKY